MSDCGHNQCPDARCLFPNRREDPCPRCGKPVEGTEIVWFRDGQGWQHETCSRKALSIALP